MTFSKLLFPAITVAEVFSWRGVLITNNFWHFLEESIWGTCEVGLTASALAMRSQYQGSPKQFMSWMALCGAIYVTYMFTLDIPTYYSRWRNDQTNDKVYTGFRKGLRNLAFHWRKTHDPQDWEGEFIWMMVYWRKVLLPPRIFLLSPDYYRLPRNPAATELPDHNPGRRDRNL